MNRVLQITAALAVLASTVGMPVFQVRAEPAAAINLLTNPGFESPFPKQCCHTEPWYLPNTPIDEVQVANGWRAWWLEPGDADHPTYCAGCNAWHRPEWREAAPFANRIRSGENAQKYFTFYSVHEAGMYQQVSGVSPGVKYRFSVYMHAWSTNGGALTSTIGDNDLDMRVGIDPTGGTNPFSANIVWSAPFNTFDSWALYSVDAVAQNSTITVYTHTKPRWGLEHNDVYVDDASLTMSDGGSVAAPTSTPTTAPTATLAPTSAPTTSPAANPTAIPTSSPTAIPPAVLTAIPTPTSIPLTTYVIQRGDTVFSIAQRFGTTVSAILSVNSIANARKIYPGQVIRIPASASAPPTSAPAPTSASSAPTTAASASGGSLATYTIQRGDTLFSIGRKFNTTTAAIVAVNSGIDPNKIFAGQVINLPFTASGGAPVTYVVQRGDTLRSIAERFATTIAKLQEINGIVDPNKIFVGQTLVIP